MAGLTRVFRFPSAEDSVKLARDRNTFGFLLNLLARSCLAVFIYVGGRSSPGTRKEHG